MELWIDKKPLSCNPRSIDVTPAGELDVNLPGGQRVMVESAVGVTVEAVFGAGGITAAGLAELEKLRGSQGLHTITFEDLACNKLIDLYTFMPRIPRTYQGEGSKTGHVYSETTLTFKQVYPFYDLVVFEWWLYQTAGYTVADGKWSLAMPCAGKFLIDGLGGYCPDLTGAGGEQISIQLRNSTQGFDYLTTNGKFKINSATGMLEDSVFRSDRSFIKNDVIKLDVDAITTWAPAAGSAIFVIQAFCEVFKP